MNNVIHGASFWELLSQGHQAPKQKKTKAFWYLEKIH